MKIVILAGGGGTRLWPLSRRQKPKQFSKIMGTATMFEETLARFLPKYGPENIYVCLSQSLLNDAKALAPQIPDENFLIEPGKRDTAPAMGFVAAYLFNKFPDEPIAYVPADHFIGDTRKFLKIFDRAEELIRETGKMIDIAIQPSFPSTVLGYTKINGLVSDEQGIEVYNFLGHTEKPNFEVAKKYLEDGSYLWHASYYMWTPRKILESFQKYNPVHYESLEKISLSLASGDKESVRTEFEKMPQISFDYAVTEKIDPTEVMIVKGDFGWSDVGAFDVLYDAQRRNVDSSNNLVTGKWVGEDTRDCLIYGGNDKIIATIGVSDLIVVDTGDVILICPKSKSQEVKKIIAKLQGTDREVYL